MTTAYRLFPGRLAFGVGSAVVSLISLILLLTGPLAGTARADEPATRVILNNKPTPVFFNDGDSFRVLEGPLKGGKARIAGFNTLENHGPVHQWGDWTAKELYFLAKLATLHARRGVWECTTDGNLDTYGRMLVFCHGLGEELIRLGLAHAMTVSDEPAEARYLAAQEQAIAARRGIWAHGTPGFVLTSLHSEEEDTDGTGTYNRLVSTQDGHSVKWQHTDRYQECQNICQIVYPVDEAKVGELVAALAADPGAQALMAPLSAEDQAAVVRDFAAYRHMNRKVPERDRDALKAVLDGYVASGRFGQQGGAPASCMVHVAFNRRYGTGKAACLK